eukprot:scaffold4717_cov274-Pinguiococcus_pyrenoidosus.AAC.9
MTTAVNAEAAVNFTESAVRQKMKSIVGAFELDHCEAIHAFVNPQIATGNPAASFPEVAACPAGHPQRLIPCVS